MHGVKPAFVEEKLLENPEQLPSGSGLPFISNCLVKNINKHWRQEKQTVPYETYLDFEKEFASENPVKRSILNVSNNDFREMTDICKQNQSTKNTNVSISEDVSPGMLFYNGTNTD